MKSYCSDSNNRFLPNSVFFPIPFSSRFCSFSAGNRLARDAKLTAKEDKERGKKGEKKKIKRSSLSAAPVTVEKDRSPKK